MNSRNNEQKNNENPNRKPCTGVGNLFLTLLRKNREAVEVELTNGRVLSGYVDAFDDQSVIIGIKTPGKNGNAEVYATRGQIVTITPEDPLRYLDVVS